MKIAFFLILSSFLSIASANGMIKKLPKLPAQNQIASAGVEAHTIEQAINHDDRSDGTFTQRYWFSKAFAANSAAPILVYLCGEHDCAGGWASPYMDPWAEPVAGNTASIEHRYYGQSRPFSSLTTENLKYLTMEQALIDTAQVLLKLRKDYNLTGPFIVMGGSYSGALAVQLRTAYPNLVAGAWSSSGPSKMIADFKGYDVKMTQIMGLVCAANMRKVIAHAEAAVKNPEQFKQLREKFFMPNLTHPVDFLFGISDVAAAAVQYNETEWVCGSFTSGDAVEDYAKFLSEINEEWGYTGEAYSFGTISDTSYDSPNAGTRMFLYQQCYEVGTLQTAADKLENSTRSSLINFKYMKEACKRAFGKSFDTADNADELNDKYYKPLLKKNGPTQIFITAGLIDPTFEMSKTREIAAGSNKGIATESIEMAAHCDDINVGDNSPASVKAAAMRGMDLIKQWVHFKN
ncbi:MAG: S28 family serine protease [Bdellovibrionota bacterium]